MHLVQASSSSPMGVGDSKQLVAPPDRSAPIARAHHGDLGTGLCGDDVSHRPNLLHVLRALLGAAEAGFFPGVILYLTYWFPKRYIGQIFGSFYFGAPLAFIAGGPLSGSLLELRGVAGLQGWQWMFVVEGLLATIVGAWPFYRLEDRPSEARWLSANQRRVLGAVIARESQQKFAQKFTFALLRPKLLMLAITYFLIQLSVYGVTFYLPVQVASLIGRRVGLLVGLVSAIPWICVLIATYSLPKIAVSIERRFLLAAATLAASAISIALSATTHPVLGLGAC